MEYTLSEIVKHKNNIINSSNTLINTFEVNKEIFISEELIKETQFLLTLLNIKKNLIFGQNFPNNNMNLINPMQNQINIFNNNQFQHMMTPKQIINTFNNNVQESLKDKIALFFRHNFIKEYNSSIMCNLDDKISDVIEKYKKKTGCDDIRSIKFIHNSYLLNPSTSVRETGLINGSVIFVLRTKDVKGG